MSGVSIAEQMGGIGGRAVSPPEPEDPFQMVQMFMDAPADDRFYREMTETFVEEYMRMGWTDGEIFALFQEPFYRGTYNILRQKGETFVKNIIHEVRHG